MHVGIIFLPYDFLLIQIFVCESMTKFLCFIYSVYLTILSLITYFLALFGNPPLELLGPRWIFWWRDFWMAFDTRRIWTLGEVLFWMKFHIGSESKTFTVFAQIGTSIFWCWPYTARNNKIILFKIFIEYFFSFKKKSSSEMLY